MRLTGQAVLAKYNSECLGFKNLNEAFDDIEQRRTQVNELAEACCGAIGEDGPGALPRQVGPRKLRMAHAFRRISPQPDHKYGNTIANLVISFLLYISHRVCKIRAYNSDPLTAAGTSPLHKAGCRREIRKEAGR